MVCAFHVTPLFLLTLSPHLIAPVILLQPFIIGYPPAALVIILAPVFISTACPRYPRGLTGIDPAVTHTCQQNRTIRESRDPVLHRLVPAWCKPLGYFPLGLQASERAPQTECMVLSYTKPAVVRYHTLHGKSGYLDGCV